MIDQLYGENFYMLVIIGLMPLTASMLLVQTNPYNALILRGILGAIAALVYALLGAADVALTEALVGTMLSITLYAVAVRSSLVLRLGVLESSNLSDHPLLPALRAIIKPYHLRLELVPYPQLSDLQQALDHKEIHALCTNRESATHLKTRVPRLYEIFQAELSSDIAQLEALDVAPMILGSQTS
ncbi:DUF4040 domain-containing protein [filamentous cyanobacterium LEGE 11480]|uniref:DUF4040 domain-containing protein n=1 Tax=Romeriopsis navalis LEGE 11480 TaxID=2777977 RepID=A0A928VNP0_9CYAN|nr:DUF4040 domain-containing protein [Romeriopsis navalis]MBE9029214.1 DUF4040 domain-containing protein [Romeriopsis navalis LEGE 11480]